MYKSWNNLMYNFICYVIDQRWIFYDNCLLDRALMATCLSWPYYAIGVAITKRSLASCSQICLALVILRPVRINGNVPALNRINNPVHPLANKFSVIWTNYVSTACPPRNYSYIIRKVCKERYNRRKLQATIRWGKATAIFLHLPKSTRRMNHRRQVVPQENTPFPPEPVAAVVKAVIEKPVLTREKDPIQRDHFRGIILIVPLVAK